MKKVIKKIELLFFIFFLLVNASFGQNNKIRFKRITVQNGLSQSWVRSILQDKYGFMWFGTGGNGINKYDGYEFKIYKNDPKNKNTLTTNWINTIYEDKNGNLWVGCQKGLNLYDRDYDRFVRFSFLQSEYINGLYETDEGKLLVVGSNTIYEIKLKNNSIIPLCDNPNGCIRGIFNTSIVMDNNGNLWVGSSDGICLLDLANRSVTTFSHIKYDRESISDNFLNSIFKDSGGRIWIGTFNKGICLMSDKENRSIQPHFKNFTNDLSNYYNISKGNIRAFLNDDDGNLWIGTENGGLNILNLNGLKQGNYSFFHYKNDTYDESSLSNNSIYSLYKDNQGTIWVGTYGDGLNYYNKLLFKFDHYKHLPYNRNSISSNLVNVFFEDGDDLWVGTEGGLNVINRKTGKNLLFTHDVNNNKSIGSDAIWSIYKDSRNNIWIGTWGGGINLYNNESQTFKHYFYNENNPKGISSNNIFGIIEDKEGFLWFATMGGGLAKFDYNTNEFRSYKADFTQNNSISGDWVQTLFENSQQELWISTSDGVDILDKHSGIFTNFAHDTADLSTISYNGANVIFEDSRKNMWIGTDGGLNFFVRKDSTFIFFREEDGLPDNSIKGICEDNKGNLWLSTNNGISKFVNGINLPENPQFLNYNISDGLQGNEFNRRSCYKDNKGYLYFGGTNGYNVFHPDSLKENLSIPKIVFTDFLLFNKPVRIREKDSPLSKAIGVSDKIILQYKQSVITIKYSALNYISPEKNQYAYILEGFEKGWNKVGSQRTATYTNLNPGEYTFRVIASNNNGLWNKTGASIKIIVLPPWYKTWWFRIILILFIISCIIAISVIRERNIKRKNIELEEKVHERTTELFEVNTVLEEKQQEIEEQAKKLVETNTYLEEQKNELKKLNVTKDKFFSIISHDLKNPFNIVLGFSELLINKYDSLKEEKKLLYINNIFSSVTRIYKLLDNLLQWSRSQMGIISFNPQLFDLSDVLTESINLIQDTCNKKQLEIKNKISRDTFVYAEKNMITTVIRNLLSNAVKFTENGSITVTSQKRNKFLEIGITDTGTGIGEGNITKLFKIDQSFSSIGTMGETGTGLGLILCNEFIDKNRGKLWCESIVGKGSSFYFTLFTSKSDFNY